eukprot:PLAT4357.5.p1 GENE.PLAT4357.5~~PLAT4357.5.p1  ORF type:complete len:537 (+),score=255.35 PLAT4357.5:72-1682(+)
MAPISFAYKEDSAFPKGSSPAGVNFDDRVQQDHVWKIIYWLFFVVWLVLLALGIGNGASLNIAHSAPSCFIARDDRADSCAKVRSNSSYWDGSSRRLEDMDEDMQANLASAAFGRIIGSVCFAVAMSLLIGAGWMQLLSKAAKPIVYATVCFIPLALVISGIACLLNPQLEVLGYVLLGLTALVVLILFCVRKKLALCAALLTEAMNSFKANYSIFCWGLVFVAVLALVGLISLAGIVMVVMSSEWKVYSTDFCERCDVEFSTLQRVHAALILIWLGWTSQLMMQIRMYIIGAATGIWYFHEDDARASSGVRTALKWAVTTSFGTNAFAALVLYVVNEIKRQLNQAARKKGNPIVAIIACCILSCIGAILEFFNTFLVVVCAVTGDDFCTSCKTTYHMLSRNLLSALVVDSVSEIVLGLGAFVFALVVGGLGGLIAYGTVSVPNELHFVKVIVGVVGGVFALIMGLIILFYFAGLALNFISAVFVCYAMDKDQGNAPTPAHAGVHECFAGKHIDPATGKPAAPGAPAAEVPMAKAV